MDKKRCISKTRTVQTKTGKWQPVHLYLDNDFAEMATGFQIFERRRDILLNSTSALERDEPAER